MLGYRVPGFEVFTLAESKIFVKLFFRFLFKSDIRGGRLLPGLFGRRRDAIRQRENLWAMDNSYRFPGTEIIIEEAESMKNSETKNFSWLSVGQHFKHWAATE